MLCVTLFTLLSVSSSNLGPDSPGPRSHWEVLVQPSSYQSRSGALRLDVRSLARDWRLGGHLRMEREGLILWERDQPLVFWDAEVLDDGRVVGVGYRDAEVGRQSDLVVTLLGVDGELVWQHVEPGQAWTNGMSWRVTYPTPIWCVRSGAEEVVFQRREGGARKSAEARLCVLGLTDGADRGIATLRRPDVTKWGSWWLREVELLSGQGPAIACWTNHRGECVVTLHDCREQPWADLAHWLLEPSGERAGGSRPDARFPHLRPRHASGGEFGFELVTEEGSTPRTIEVGIAAGRWSLNVLPPTSPSNASDLAESPPEIELTELASIELTVPSLEVAEDDLPVSLTWIEAFGFDADGNVEILSSDPSGLVARTLDRAGAVSSTVHLGQFDYEVDDSCEIADGPGGTWLVAVEEGASTTVHRIDVARGTTSRVLEFARPVETLVAFGDGGFALVEPYGCVLCFDAEGQPLAPPTEGAEGDEAVGFECRLLGRSLPHDAIALEQSAEGEMRLRVFSDGGRTQHVLALPSESELLVDDRWDALVRTSEGAVWVAEEGDSGTLLVEFDDSGEVARRLAPRFLDGAPFAYVYDALGVGPDGSFWSANGDVLGSFSPNGEPGIVLGRHFEPPAWEDTWHWVVDRLGRLLVRSSDRGAHVFDLEGRVLGHMQLPSTCDEPLSLIVATDGQGMTWWKVPFLDHVARFGAQGEFLGFQNFGPYEVIRFFGAGLERWTSDDRELARWNTEGQLQQRLTTRPDGAWWRDIGDLEVSTDGSRLVVQDALRSGGVAEGALLACYDFGAGTEWTLDAAHTAHLSLAGDWVLWGTHLVHWPTHDVRTLTIAGAKVIDTPSGPEVWMHAPSMDEDAPMRFRRFALPDVD